MPPRQQYVESHNRLIFLDYDGTLVDFAPTPSDARPTLAVLNLLKKISSDPYNTVVIISGRDQRTLDQWLGHLDVSLVAEHGLFVKEPGKTWQATRKLTQTWKSPVRTIMNGIKIPGAFVEEKAMALVWHCRQADPVQAEVAAQGLRMELAEIPQCHGLRVMPGHKIIEVMPAGTDKGQAARHWLQKRNYDFILAAGDDTTDEDLFRTLPQSAFKIKVGRPSTAAPHTVPNPAELLAILSGLAQAASH